MHVVEQALVFPRHTGSSPINDNYNGFPAKLNLSHQRLGLIVKETQEQTFKISKLQTRCVMYRCCQSCSYCNFSRAATKERLKSRSWSEQNKACQSCLFCKSMSFCPICSKCPTCCHRDQCWRKASELLASLAKVGFKSRSGFSAEGWLQSSFQGKATTQPLSLDCEQICKSPQEQGPLGSSSLSNTKTSRRKGGCQVILGFLQSSFSGSKAQQKMASNLGSEQAQSFPGYKHLQNGDPRDHPVVSSKRGMGHVVGLHRCILPHSHSPEVKKIQVSHKQGQLSVQIPSLRFGNGPIGIYQSGQGGRADGSSTGYQDPPIPR